MRREKHDGIVVTMNTSGIVLFEAKLIAFLVRE